MMPIEPFKSGILIIFVLALFNPIFPEMDLNYRNFLIKCLWKVVDQFINLDH